jgi:hypothetical protein
MASVVVVSIAAAVRRLWALRRRSDPDDERARCMRRYLPLGWRSGNRLALVYDFPYRPNRGIQESLVVSIVREEEANASSYGLIDEWSATVLVVRGRGADLVLEHNDEPFGLHVAAPCVETQLLQQRDRPRR